MINRFSQKQAAGSKVPWGVPRYWHTKKQNSSTATPRTRTDHVRGIGVEGWDETDEGVGKYENETALRHIENFGRVIEIAKIRHRIQDGRIHLGSCDDG